MTIAQLIAQIRAGMATKLAERDKQRKAIEALRAACAAEQSRDLTEAEATQVRAAQEVIRGIDTEIEASQARIAELTTEQERDEAADRLSREITPGAQRPAYDRMVRVGAEERTYRPDNDRKGVQFLRDVVSQFRYHDPVASERLNRHMAEEQVERREYLEGLMDRAAGTGAFAGLTVPQYLTDLYAPATAAMRPFADVCTKHDLPAKGMTVDISRITTSSSAALQTSENTSVSNTDMDDTLLSISVQTAAGQQTLSLQAVERGTGIEDVTMNDLIRRYASVLDSTLLNQATTGLSAVAQAVAYTDASPTAIELYPKIINAGVDVEAALLGMGFATHAVMHSRRWGWLQSQVSPNWPGMTQPGIPTQAMGVNNGVGYNKGVRGLLPNGLQVIVDNNVTTTAGAEGPPGTEDEIYVVPEDECHLWEDPQAPLLIRAEQPAAASLGLLLVVYGYFAYTFSRYTNGMAKVGGTGLVTPTF